MPSCFVCGRSQNAKNKELGISFHKIPKKEENSNQWLSFIRDCSIDANIKEKSILCSEHFTPDLFSYYNRRKVLKENAVPSVMIERVKSAKVEVPEIKFIPTGGNSATVIESVQPIYTLNHNEQSYISNKPSTSFIIKKSLQSRELFSEAQMICDTGTPKKQNLKWHISTLVRANFNPRKKIKLLNQQIRRQRKQISSLKCVVKVLEEKNLIHQNQADLII